MTGTDRDSFVVALGTTNQELSLRLPFHLTLTRIVLPLFKRTLNLKSITFLIADHDPVDKDITIGLPVQ